MGSVSILAMIGVGWLVVKSFAASKRDGTLMSLSWQDEEDERRTPRHRQPPRHHQREYDYYDR